MNGLDLQKVYNYSIYPKVSKVKIEKDFVNFDNGEMCCAH